MFLKKEIIIIQLFFRKQGVREIITHDSIALANIE